MSKTKMKTRLIFTIGALTGILLLLARPADEAVYNMLTKRHRDTIEKIEKYDPTAPERYRVRISNGVGGTGYGVPGGAPYISPNLTYLKNVLREYQEGSK